MKRPDTLTVIAITVVVAVITDLLHEALGHGGACLLSHGQPILLTTVSFDCSFDSRFISAGGTLVNLLAGTVFLFAGRAVRSPRLKLFFWLLLTFNFLDSGGYFLFSGIANIGDWADVIRGFRPSWAWHALLTAVGAASYLFFVWISLRELQPLLSPDQPTRLARARRYLLIPYFTHGTLFTSAGLFNPIGMILVAISAMAASFGGCSAMVWMGLWLRGNLIAPPAEEGAIVERSPAWIAAAVVLAVPFVFVLGRGIRF